MQKVVSYKIAKVIKDAGYPQDYHNGDSWCYDNGQYPDESECDNLPVSGWLLLPTYIDVWMWLWRVKNIYFAPCRNGVDVSESQDHYWHITEDIEKLGLVEDPEEAIIIAVNYIVDNNLIERYGKENV